MGNHVIVIKSFSFILNLLPQTTRKVVAILHTSPMESVANPIPMTLRSSLEKETSAPINPKRNGLKIVQIISKFLDTDSFYKKKFVV